MSTNIDPAMEGLLDMPTEKISLQIHENDRDFSSEEVPDEPNTQAQQGIQNVEAITTTWSKTALAATCVLIWLVYFVEGMLSGTQNSLLPYVTSAFAEHSLTPTVSIVSSVIGGCTNFTIAKVLDVFGRPQGYLLCIIIAEIGLIMMAACRQVEMYAAAMVFNTVGNTGLQYALSVFVADTSSLHSRALMQAIAYSPNMITCWLAGPIATGFLNGPGWPWAFGMFSILVPLTTLPLYGILQYNLVWAKKHGRVSRRNNTGRNAWQSIAFYIREFDGVGLVLISTGVACFLLPFDLYSLQSASWSSTTIICLLVFGIALLIAFVLWERFFASVTFIPYSLLSNRTSVGACALAATIFFSYFCWNSFFGSFLQVVSDLNVTDTSYVMQIYTVGTVIFSLIAGVVIKLTGRFKPVSLYGGIPLSILGIGLMVYFRQPGTSIGYIVMCQIFISSAGGILMITDEIAMLATVSHQHIAAALALLGFFSNIGAAIGLTITSAIWQHTLPDGLARYLPAAEQSKLSLIYADINAQLSYPVGSPTRDAIQHAYADAQKNILIAATSVWVVGLAAVLLWRNIDVSKIKQVKGQVV